MSVIYTKDIAKEAAKNIAQKINSLLVTQKKVNFGVCGGRSASAVFKELQTHQLNWNNIHVFLIDERKVPIKSDQRNDTLVRQYLKPIHIHQYQTTDQYNLEINKQGGYMDIIFASMGEDGHIASLFPNHESIKNEELFFIDVYNSPKEPKERVSASRKLLLHAKHGVLIASGNAKKEAFEKLITTRDVLQLPACLFHFLESSAIISDIGVDNE